jgi:hypothetical protein
VDESNTLAGASDGRLVDAHVIASLLGLPVTWVRAQSRSGDMPVRVFGKYRRYSVPEVMSWAESRKRRA